MSLMSRVLTRRVFHFIFSLQYVGISVVLVSFLSKVLPTCEERFAFLLLVARQPHLHPGLSFTPSLAPINGWKLFTIKSDHPMDKTKDRPYHDVHLMLLLGWFWRKEEIFHMLSFLIKNGEGGTLFSVHRAHRQRSGKIRGIQFVS